MFISVNRSPTDRTKGLLHLPQATLRCALGRGGISVNKFEGDGATPRGIWQMQEILYRSDRVNRPVSRLKISPIATDDGWCDAAGDRNYNRKVPLPYRTSAEHLWRRDHIYDIIVILSHNRRPRIQNRGSAVFMHLARENYTPTAGCIALAQRDLEKLLCWIKPDQRLVIA
ncbi:MAG: L,D-transpeptidase family protein [Methyloligellaceae bacterium]